MAIEVGQEQIEPWPTRVFRPQLTMRVGADHAETLAVLAASLAAVDFKPKDRTPHGFRAVWFKWGWLLAGETAYRTEILVRVDGETIWIGTGRNPHESRPRTKAIEGLNAAVRELRRRGRVVHWTEWTQQPQSRRRWLPW